eukprot:COSAG05_NODE_1089_length_5920_cov_2.369009_4_plen_261_part_00
MMLKCARMCTQDYDVGALSSVVNGSLSGGRPWGFVVERNTQKLVAITTGEPLYDSGWRNIIGMSFSASRLSPRDSVHSSVSAAAQYLQATGWPAVYNRTSNQSGDGRTTGYEYQTTLFTDYGLDWLVVAGMDIACESGQIWVSITGSCVGCPGGTQPVNGVCKDCLPGQAGSNGRCETCAVGKQPNPDSTACENCAEDEVSTTAQCKSCEFGKQPNEQKSKCFCKPGLYDREFGLLSCFGKLAGPSLCVVRVVVMVQISH